MTTVGLYVGNLPGTVSRQALQELFSPFNPIMVAYSPGRDFAYVQVNPNDVEPAVQSLDGLRLVDRELMVRRIDDREVAEELVSR